MKNYDFTDIVTYMLAIHASDNRIKLHIHPDQRCILQYDKSAKAEIQSIKIFVKYLSLYLFEELMM